MAWLPERLPAAPLPDWTRELPSDGVGGIAVADGLVIVGGRDAQDAADLWLAFDAETGEERWRILYPAPGELDYGNSPRATPLVAEGIAYLMGALGHLHAVDAATGLVLWQQNLAELFATPRLEWGLTGSPLLVDGKLIVQPGGRGACLAALDPANGKVLWKSSGEKPGHASFIVANFGDKPQLVGYDAVSLGGWDPASGERLWTVKPRLAGDFNVPTPILLDGQRLFVCTENNGARIYSLDSQGLPSPQPSASYAGLNPDSHTPVASDGRIYGVADGLHCLDANHGLRELWVSEDEAFFGYVSLIASGRRLLAYTEAAELVLLEDEGDSAQVLSRLKLASDVDGVLSHPALVGSKLYVRLGARLACFDLANVED